MHSLFCNKAHSKLHCFQSVIRRHNLHNGFTLTETAIVLGIIGLILGAIWVGTEKIYINFRVNSGIRLVRQVDASLHSMYGINQIPSPYGDITDALIGSKAFPADLINGTVVENPWGATFTSSTYGVKVYTDSASQYTIILPSAPPC